MLTRCLCMGALLLWCGCKDDPTGPPSQLGQFGAVEFNYGCAGPGDAVCDTQCQQEENAELCGDKVFAENDVPAIAIETTFELTGSDGVLQSASESRLEQDGDDWRPLLPGITAILAMNGDGTVRDVIDIRVMEVESLDVGFSATYDIADDNFKGTARIVLLGEDDTPLGGALDCMWTSSDEAIVALTSDPTDNAVDFETGQPGTATLEVTLGEHTGSVEIEVAP